MHDAAPKYGVMICGHGSRSKSAVTEFAVLAEKLAPMFPDWPVEYGYLEFATPVIKTGLDKLREQGVNHVLAVPGMLFAAGHAKNDIPSVLNTYAAEHGITIQYGRELAVDLQMLQAAGDRDRRRHRGGRQGTRPRRPRGYLSCRDRARRFRS